MAITQLDLRSMLRQFGVVTVMDVDAYKAERHTAASIGSLVGVEEGEWDSKSTFAGKKLFSLKTLKIANINTEGPTETATGGQNADVLLKYGKTFTIEMQDALGKYEVLENIYGANSNGSETTGATIVSVTDRFPGEITLVGKTFVVDKATGAKQPILVVIPFYLGDGIFNLTQDAEGDISVFDMNGNILRFSNGSSAAKEIPNAANADYGYLYDKGADNQFYFFAQESVLDMLKANDYSEVWNATQAYRLVKDNVIYKMYSGYKFVKGTEKVWYWDNSAEDPADHEYKEIAALSALSELEISDLNTQKMADGTTPIYEFILAATAPTPAA